MLCIKTSSGWKPWIASSPVCVNSNDLQGVFSPTALKDAQVQTAAHANHYVACVEKYIDGGYPGTGEARLAAMWRDARRFKMHGPFGEVL